MKNNIRITKFEVENKADNKKLEIPKVCSTIIIDGVVMVIHEITIDESEEIRLLCHIPEDKDKVEGISNEEIIINASDLFDSNIIITGSNYILKSNDLDLIHDYDARRFKYVTNWYKCEEN